MRIVQEINESGGDLEVEVVQEEVKDDSGHLDETKGKLQDHFVVQDGDLEL